MADEADQADERQGKLTEAVIASIRRKADLPAGEPGECEYCGEHSPRLVRGACAPCRDRRGMG